jgi:hypothetical protein
MALGKAPSKNYEIVFHKGASVSQRLDKQDLFEGTSKPSGIGQGNGSITLLYTQAILGQVY